MSAVHLLILNSDYYPNLKLTTPLASLTHVFQASGGKQVRGKRGVRVTSDWRGLALAPACLKNTLEKHKKIMPFLQATTLHVQGLMVSFK